MQHRNPYFRVSTLNIEVYKAILSRDVHPVVITDLVELVNQQRQDEDIPRLAYTTIKTAADRMWESGVLSREKRGKKYYYGEALPADDVKIMALADLVTFMFGRDTEDAVRLLSKLREKDYEDAEARRRDILLDRPHWRKLGDG